MRTQVFAGVMTGNSMDAADAVLLAFDNNNFTLQANARIAMPDSLAEQMLTLSEKGGRVDHFMKAQNALTELCATTVLGLNAPPDITAVGCHGQTLCHNPADGYTWQLFNGALMAKLTGIDTICDFRNADIAAGGQGAPLTPAFHHYLFSQYAPCAVVNIGGIANVTILDNNGGISGYDTGPGNILMDAWHKKQQGGDYDQDGTWAESGKIIPTLLNEMLAHPYFSMPPPKSCGREEFSLTKFYNLFNNNPAADIQRTLLELTAQNIATAAAQTKHIYLCGGGGRNKALVARLSTLLDQTQVSLSDDIGLPMEQVEAAAFAWLAKQYTDKQATTCTTGAKQARILGALYPASPRSASA